MRPIHAASALSYHQISKAVWGNYPSTSYALQRVVKVSSFTASRAARALLYVIRRTPVREAGGFPGPTRVPTYPECRDGWPDLFGHSHHRPLCIVPGTATLANRLLQQIANRLGQPIEFFELPAQRVKRIESGHGITPRPLKCGQSTTPGSGIPYLVKMSSLNTR